MIQGQLLRPELTSEEERGGGTSQCGRRVTCGGQRVWSRTGCSETDMVRAVTTTVITVTIVALFNLKAKCQGEPGPGSFPRWPHPACAALPPCPEVRICRGHQVTPPRVPLQPTTDCFRRPGAHSSISPPALGEFSSLPPALPDA